jgi:hypothetical protein
MTIRLHVERLVLDGVTLSAAERGRLEGALVGELTRLLALPGMREALGASGRPPSVTAPGIRVAPNDSGAALGVRLAHSVCGALVAGPAPAAPDAGPRPGGHTR